MADTLELASYEQIAVLLSQLMTNYNALADNYFNMFYSTTPADITVTLYNSNGTLTEYTIPNRAKDFNFIRNGEGSPEGVVRAPIGTTYQDTKNGVFYLKEIGTGSQGWVRIPVNTNVEHGNGSPEGVLVRAKGTLFIDDDSAAMYIKTTTTGNDGWSLIAIDTNGMANADLSNLSPEGENHFANSSLSNLDEYGQELMDSKANRDLNNLSGSGENHFANPSLDNLNEYGRARIAVKEYLSDETYSVDDVVLSVYAGEVKLYRSLIGNNQGNPLTDATKWQEIQMGGGSRSIGERVTSELPIIDATLHELDGAVLAGSGIYADFVNYIADLYEQDPTADYFVQGTTYEFIPTGNLINNNGVISGFSSNDYCKCNITFNPGTDTWEMNWKVITGDDVTSEQEIISADGTNELELGVGSSHWDVELSGIGEIGGSYTVLPNTTYYLKLAYDGINLTLDYSLDGATYINDITQVVSTSFSDTDIYIGIDKDALLQEWEGSVDLWGCNISVDGTIVWQGVTDLGITPEEAWWDSVNRYGVCDKFVYNPTNRTVRLPKNFTNMRYMIDSNFEGNQWYRIYNDGWCEQGGVYDNGSSSNAFTATISFLKEFDDTNYVANATPRTTNEHPASASLYDKQTDGMSLFVNRNYNSDANVRYVSWKAEGYIDIIDTLDYEARPLYEYIVVATGVKTPVEIDIDEIVTDLNNKANKDFSNCGDDAKNVVLGWVGNTSIGMPDWDHVYALVLEVATQVQQDGFIYLCTNESDGQSYGAWDVGVGTDPDSLTVLPVKGEVPGTGRDNRTFFIPIAKDYYYYIPVRSFRAAYFIPAISN